MSPVLQLLLDLVDSEIYKFDLVRAMLVVDDLLRYANLVNHVLRMVLPKATGTICRTMNLLPLLKR
jgi:hypothetical protein